MRALGVVVALPLMLLATRAPAAENASPHPPSAAATRALPKALSADDVAALHAGAGMGLAKPAELNRHPGPRHALDLADKLDLTPVQRREIQAIYDRMHTQAVALGGRIVAQESALDQLFADSPTAPPARVRAVTTDIARLNGLLRFAHLEAHIATARALTRTQVETYDRLRGNAHSRAADTATSKPPPAEQPPAEKPAPHTRATHAQ